MSAARWRHEVRRVGVSALVMPPVVFAFGGVLVATAGNESMAARLAAGVSEMGLPLAAGIGAASLIGADPAVELQLSLPSSYRSTLARRLAVIVGGPVALALLGAGAAQVAGVWRVPGGWPQTQLVWLVPLVWLTALGAVVAAVSADGRVASVVVGALWVSEVIFPAWFIGHVWQPLYLFANGRVTGAPFTDHGRLTNAWLQDRLTLVAVAVALGALAWVSLRSPERLLRGASA